MSFATEFATRLEQKLNADIEADIARGVKYAAYTRYYTAHVEAGQKYDRIVLDQVDRYSSAHVHAFVTKDGKLVKASGWKAPAKDKDGIAVRYDISTPEGMDEAIFVAEFTGGYLYAGAYPQYKARAEARLVAA